jgi:hypothetical protein
VSEIIYFCDWFEKCKLVWFSIQTLMLEYLTIYWGQCIAFQGGLYKHSIEIDMNHYYTFVLYVWIIQLWFFAYMLTSDKKWCMSWMTMIYSFLTQNRKRTFLHSCPSCSFTVWYRTRKSEIGHVLLVVVFFHGFKCQREDKWLLPLDLYFIILNTVE